MRYDEYADRFLRHREIAEIRELTRLSEGAESLPLLHAHVSGRRSLVVTAGFHGDEVAGALTLLEHLPEIVREAAAGGVGLDVFPCLNPSGFTDATRYNRSGEAPNNDFLRYEIAPSVWVGELGRGQGFLRCEPFRGGPKETRALLAALEALPAPDAALDLHQDAWIPGSLAYAYILGPRARYLPFIEETARHLPIARDWQVDDEVRTDADGLIDLHDGSVTDYMFRRGVPYVAALETTTETPLPTSHEVNLAWIRGFIALAAGAQA